jgi:hypothetical protein
MTSYVRTSNGWDSANSESGKIIASALKSLAQSHDKIALSIMCLSVTISVGCVVCGGYFIFRFKYR